MSIDDNTPILNGVGYDLDDLSSFKDLIPQPEEPDPDPVPTKIQLDAIRDKWIQKKGRASIPELIKASKKGSADPLRPHQISAIKAEVDYALATYAAQLFGGE